LQTAQQQQNDQRHRDQMDQMAKALKDVQFLFDTKVKVTENMRADIVEFHAKNEQTNKKTEQSKQDMKDLIY